MASALHNYDHDEDVAEIDPRREIKRFVRNVETPGTFAFGSSLLSPAPNLTVQGIGNIPLPLSNEGVDKLRDAAEVAPFGHGTEAKVDETVRQAWQIDGALIGLSDGFAEAIGKRLALHAAEKLGLRARALGVEASLYKLVMYENGGHFRLHKDTEKEAGMFGTLVVQLPTAQGHEGGALIVRHRKKKQVFAWHDPDGSYAQRHSGDGAVAGAAVQQGAPTPPSLPVRCAAFYGDCEHELRPVTNGVRLCLLYNLVRTTPGPPPVAAIGQSGSAAQLRLSDAMTTWGRGDGNCGVEKFILPLEHEYTKASLSFGGLKGRDRAMADALRACREVDLYLARVVKHESGTAGNDGYGGGYGRRRAWDDYRPKRCKYDSIDEEDEHDEDDDYYSDDDDQVMDMDCDIGTDFSMKNWMALDDNPVALRLSIDVDSEVLDCSGEGDSDDDCEVDEEETRELLFPFGTDPDKRECEGYTGNYPPALDFWYHRAVLILWPASATMNTALRCGVDTALSVARQRSTRYGATDVQPLADLARIVSLAERTVRGHGFATDANHAASVLGLCAAAEVAGLASSRRFLRLLAGSVPAAVGTPGLQSEGLARGLAELVRAVGWPAVGEDVMRLVKACNLEQAGNIAVAAQELSTLPQQQHPQQQPVVELQKTGVGVKVEMQTQQQKQAKVEVHESDVGIKVEAQAGQQQPIASVSNVPQQQQAKVKLQQGGVGVKVEAQAQAGQPQQQPATSVPNIPQQQQLKVELHESSVGVKAEGQVEQLQQEQTAHVAAGSVSSSSSVGALIASTYAKVITSNSGALGRVTAEGVAGIVHLLLLGLPGCNGQLSGTIPQLLTFASAGSARLQTGVLARAVHEFRERLSALVSATGAASAAAQGAGGGQSRLVPDHSYAIVILATGLTTRNFGELGATVVKTFAEDVIWLASRADGAGGLEQGFAGAVLTGLRSCVPSQVSKAQEQLQAVFKSKAVQSAVRGGGDGAVFWRTLASERLGKLQAHAPPVFSWRQPNAILEEHPQVQQFLRGPEKEMTYTRSGTFTNLQHARNFSNKYFTSWFSTPRHFSARCEPNGRGRNAYVCITKSTQSHDEKVRACKGDQTEAAVILALLGSGIGSGSSHGGGSSGSGERGISDGVAAGGSRVGVGNILGPSSAGNVKRRAKVEVVDLCDSP